MKNLSTTGYKNNSPDKDKPYNVIPSGEITMKGVKFPVLGIDNKGNCKVMQPDTDHSFQGDTVLEVPLHSETINKVSSLYNKIFKKTV